MNELTINKEITITSREVAEMMGVPHFDVLKKLDGAKDRKGIIEILNDHQMSVVEYFMESTYKDAKGEERKCYLITKIGCDFLANKFTGEKGIIFTAKYVQRFRAMEQALSKTRNSYMIEDSLERARVWMEEEKQRRALLEEKILLTDKIKKDEPLVELAKKRLTKGGVVSITDATKTFNLKKGKITSWAKDNGYIHKTQIEVNKIGEEYFKIYDNGGFRNWGITEKGLGLINNNVKDIA